VTVRSYGWLPDLPDHRDLVLTLQMARGVPTSVDLRDGMPSVWDQGPIGSCTSHAIIACYLHTVGSDAGMPSRLWHYWAERWREGTTAIDCGAMLRTGAKIAAKYGLCLDGLWPYEPARVLQTPPDRCWGEALTHHATQYHRVYASVSALKAVLAQGHPVAFGAALYESFEGDDVMSTGVVPMPEPGESQLGGHAMTVVGYDDARMALLVRNSWGDSWGDEGHGWLPYAYVAAGMVSDCWVITAAV